MPRTLHITLHHLYVCVLAGEGGGGRAAFPAVWLTQEGDHEISAEEHFLCNRFMQVGTFS